LPGDIGVMSGSVICFFGKIVWLMKIAMTLAASLAYSALVLGEEGYLADEIEPGNHFFRRRQTRHGRSRLR
jgi:hypothetical protein